MNEPAPLSEAFMARPRRFRLLKKGISRAGWEDQSLRLLEPGCSIADAAAMMAESGYNVSAVDLSQDLINMAVDKHGDVGGLDLFCANAENLPFDDESFDGIYCEAAFSPMPHKDRVLREYHRVLRADARILINDFVIRNDTGENLRDEVVHIPCFAGVQTRECYEDLFGKAGFELIEYHDEYGELVGITSWLCKFYKVKPFEIGGYLSMYFHQGATEGESCSLLTDEEPSDPAPEVDDGNRKCGAFFKKSDLSYCQMIFRKK